MALEIITQAPRSPKIVFRGLNFLLLPPRGGSLPPPPEKEIPGLYRQVSDLAYQTGMAVSLFQPRPPATRDVYEEVPISISAEADYHQLGTFLDRIARLSRIVNLTDMKITGISRPTGTIRADLTLATYVFRPEGAPPSPAPGARPGARPPAPPPPGGAR